ncbi:MAG TPA: bifunctional riboflavin kinase/FAD synthetase [Acidimicrobiales bacterium]|jgi:riboflavin kinase/FMN adenylyltransferase|nr:bifunctional riboflavin kinase/FAD synthetase [Acidimicrobiales bacterium]
MEVLHHPGHCESSRPCAVTIGAYDGVHTGHRLVIDRVRRVAAEQGLQSAVVTFDRHPAGVVRPDSAPKLLTDLDQKLELLAGTGVDYVLLVHFDEERANETAEDFVRQVLVGCLDIKAVVVGHDFHFGHGRKGSVGLLQDMGASMGFDVTGLRLFSGGLDRDPISSTRIRRLLEDGAVGEAASLLGRPHQVRGTVMHGDKRGRELGFPTANVSLPEAIALPADGVYAGWYIRPDGIRRPAAISLGRRPTFYEESGMRLLEVFLLDFEGDLYGEEASVEFVAHLRSQARFESAQALIDQMGRDVATTRQVLGARA